MLPDGAPLTHALLRSFLGETGDKTFVLTVVLAAWCPWMGVRTPEGRGLQLLLVFLGAYAALAAQVALHAALPESERAAFRADGCAFVLLLLLAAKANVDLRRADAAAETKAAAGKSPFGGEAAADPECEEVGSGAKVPEWNAAAFSAPLPAAEPQPPPYGALQPPTTADGLFSERVSDQVVTCVLAFVVPLAAAFACEAEDKSLSALRGVGDHGGRAVAGALLGLAPAALLAVFVGFVLERQLSDQRMLLLASMALGALSVASLSQAVLHVNAASFGKPLDSGVALLSFLSGARHQ